MGLGFLLLLFWFGAGGGVVVVFGFFGFCWVFLLGFRKKVYSFS